MSETEALLRCSLSKINVMKRNGSLEPVDLSKIVKAISRSAKGLEGVDPSRVAIETIAGVVDGITTGQLDALSIATSVQLSKREPAYLKLAAALRIEVLRKEVVNQEIHSFSQSIAVAYRMGLVSEHVHTFVNANARKLDNAIDESHNLLFEYFGLENFARKQLLRSTDTGKVIETPQYFFMRLAVSLEGSPRDAVKTYRMLATQADPSHTQEWIQAEQIVAESSEVTASTDAPPFRPLMPGMGQAVAERTILRKKADGSIENWGDVAERVALGNASLASTPNYPFEQEYRLLRKHLANGNTLMSGRHLQHGEAVGQNRN